MARPRKSVKGVGNVAARREAGGQQIDVAKQRRRVAPVRANGQKAVLRVGGIGQGFGEQRGQAGLAGSGDARNQSERLGLKRDIIIAQGQFGIGKSLRGDVIFDMRQNVAVKNPFRIGRGEIGRGSLRRTKFRSEERFHRRQSQKNRARGIFKGSPGVRDFLREVAAAGFGKGICASGAARFVGKPLRQQTVQFDKV